MKLRLGARIHDVARRSDNTFEVDGVRVQARVAAIETSRFEGRTETRGTPVFVVRDGDRVFAQVGERSYQLTVVSRAVLASAHGSTALGSLDAPMPGRVTRVNVAVGESVKRGQELIVVEAMKMENALVSPNDGVVKTLAVEVGDRVAPGPALIVIEATS